MRRNEHERYRQALMEILQSSDARPRLSDEPALHADVNELAVVNHARYITDCKEQIRYSICEAARRALARMEEGEFGLCMECGEEISPKRLMAVPWADCCVECQHQREEAELLKRAA